MTVAPPSDDPALQVRPRVDFVLWAVFSTRLVGASGEVVMTAPFPSKDSVESPYRLVAITLALILDPQAKSYGDVLKIDTEIMQVTEVDDVISQLEACYEKELSLCLKDTLKPVTAEPPLSGSTHVTIT
jgi:hypothetical protein